MITFTEQEWYFLHKKLLEEYPPSVMLLRYKMKEVLGFTVREHKEWIETKPASEKQIRAKGYYKTSICLDFYNDSMETWFRLKYL